MKILKNISLKPFNTLGIKSRAKLLAAVDSIEILHELKQLGTLDNEQVMVLGEGSNVLFSNDFEGIILLNQIHGHGVVEENEEYVFLRINGGESWSHLVDYCVSRNWGGIENLSLIPGTAGAAPVQNIGAYGVELKDVFVSLEAFDLKTGELKKYDKNDCEFDYRNSIFKSKFLGRYFITDITLQLDKKPIANLEYAPLKAEFSIRNPESISIQEVSEAVKKIRRSKLPDQAKIGNAGSFFKNPVVSEEKMKELKNQFPEIPVYPAEGGNYKLAAGWLIERCGWKGKRIGDAGVHEKQALVLVNYGNATGSEILELAEKISESVFEKFGVLLEKEVRII